MQKPANPEPAAPVITAEYGQKIKFRYNHPPPDEQARIALPLRFPDFSIRLTYYDEQDHGNVEMEQFRFEVIAGAEITEIAYSFDHWSDTAHHNRHPEQFTIGGRAYTLWHYASREGLEYNEFIIEINGDPGKNRKPEQPEKKGAKTPAPPTAKTPGLGRAEKEKRRQVRSRELLRAVKKGDLDAARQALQGGARIETATPQNQRTPLLEAAARGYGEIVELLVARGASLDAVDHKGRTVLDLAGPGKIREYILKKKGNDLSFSDFRSHY